MTPLAAVITVALAFGLGILLGLYLASLDSPHADPRVMHLCRALGRSLKALSLHVRPDHPDLVHGQAIIDAFNSEK